MHLEMFMAVGRTVNKKRIVNVISITIVGMLCLMVALPVFVGADIEPNDSTSTAEPISSGDTVSGTLGEYTDQNDYYSIFLSQGDRITATMSGTGEDFDLYLYGSSTDSVESSTSSDSSETLTYTASSSGTYYVNPYAYTGSGSYTLSVTVAVGGSTSTGGDDSEPNDSVYTANSISSGDTVYGSLSEYSDPDDYYSIFLSEGDILYVTLTGTGDDFDLYLFSSSTNDVASSISGDSSENLRYTASSSGTYYVNPYAYSGSGTYTLSVSVNVDIIGSSFNWLLPLIVIIIIVIIVIALIFALRPKHTPEHQPQDPYGYSGQGGYAPPPAAPGEQYAPPPPAAPSQPSPQPEGGGFCGSCGAKMNPGFPRCPSCGNNN